MTIKAWRSGSTAHRWSFVDAPELGLGSDGCVTLSGWMWAAGGGITNLLTEIFPASFARIADLMMQCDPEAARRAFGQALLNYETAHPGQTILHAEKERVAQTAAESENRNDQLSQAEHPAAAQDSMVGSAVTSDSNGVVHQHIVLSEADGTSDRVVPIIPRFEPQSEPAFYVASDIG